jgi:hypothetical protein
MKEGKGNYEREGKGENERGKFTEKKFMPKKSLNFFKL